MVSDYHEFLKQKTLSDKPSGLSDIPDLPDDLFDFQRDVTSWALRRGRAAIFAGTGLGKSAMELAWADAVHRETGGDVLILTPLAVARQMVEEAAKFGVIAQRSSGEVYSGITVTNYQQLHKFDPDDFTGVVLDESSILKALDGKTKDRLIQAFQGTPYRLAATATPAPNDYMELGNHSEFLGIMSQSEMLSTFFVHDGGETQKWRLKGHAEDKFWEWVGSWAVVFRDPGNIGYDGSRFQLPPLYQHEHLVESAADRPVEGKLFVEEAQTLQERIQARRDSVDDRVARAAEVTSPGRPFVWWCNLNAESEALVRALPRAVEVRGSDKDYEKERKLAAFIQGEYDVLVTKPTICGFGLNFQHCADTGFVGLNDSFEQVYQAVRRFWRFGQQYPVNVHFIAAKKEGSVLENIRRKEEQSEHMVKKMEENMQDITARNLEQARREGEEYNPDEAMLLPGWLGQSRSIIKVIDQTVEEDWAIYQADSIEAYRAVPNDSIHYSLFSPPFESLYVYSASERDIANSKGKDEFWNHFRYLIREQFRTHMPGRNLSVHCMLVPTTKQHDGYIGLKDFRGDVIRAYEEAGWIYHSEVAIWKDPVTAMQRTKALGLLHKQIKKDSSMGRQGIPDYVVTFRKPGENPDPINHTDESFPVELWQQWASPIWMDINPSDTLQYQSARDEQDEKHIAPLQLEVIRRCIMLWSNPGDIVASPFMGIGSEGYVALKNGRQFFGVELKTSYYNQAEQNLRAIKEGTKELAL